MIWRKILTLTVSYFAKLGPRMKLDPRQKGNLTACYPPPGFETYADTLEWEAAFAIDCAVAAFEEAEAAVLDATIAHIEGEKPRRRGQVSDGALGR